MAKTPDKTPAPEGQRPDKLFSKQALSRLAGLNRAVARAHLVTADQLPTPAAKGGYRPKGRGQEVRDLAALCPGEVSESPQGVCYVINQAASAVAVGTAPDVGTANRDLAEGVLTRLSPKDRQVLVLREIMGYTAAESAEVLGCSELAVRIRLHRARRAMQRAAERLLDGMEHSG